MEDDLVKVAEYVIDKKIVIESYEENRILKKEDVEGILQELLRVNNIECKTKLNERLVPVIGRRQAEYELIAEVFVYKRDVEHAIELLNELNNLEGGK